jgi:hypothetical protein
MGGGDVFVASLRLSGTILFFLEIGHTCGNEEDSLETAFFVLSSRCHPYQILNPKSLCEIEYLVRYEKLTRVAGRSDFATLPY